jgi:peptidyl-dipeptidase Dcp
MNDSISTKNSEPTAAEAAPAAPAVAEVNPLLIKSDLPLQAPPFDRFKQEHFAPAFTEGMARHTLEIQAIVERKDLPTFENKIYALERSGADLTRVAKVFFSLSGTDSNDAIVALQGEVAPKLAAHGDEIFLNETLFAKVKAVHDQLGSLNLDADSKRLVERTYLGFVRAGANLDAAQKTKLKQLNGEIASAENAFSTLLRKDTLAAAFRTANKADLAGMSDDEIAAAAAAAKDAKLDGQYFITLQLPTPQPLMPTLTNRATRQAIQTAAETRGARGGEFDTRATVLKLAKLRAEKAELLGYPNYAAYVLEDQMAGTPEAVNKMLNDLAPRVVANAKKEAAALQDYVRRKEGADFVLKPWDWLHYAEKFKAEKYSFDPAQIKPYFEFDRVLKDGVFYAMKLQYGIDFVETKAFPPYHPDVRIFEVKRGNEVIGLFYADHFARASKRGGAWMDSFVDQSYDLDTKPVVINVMSIVKPVAGSPALLDFDEVTTMFHEMGHAVHGLLSRTKYNSQSGTNVPRDFVEFPSQYQEDWAFDAKILANYAKHYKTGAPIPADVLQRVLEARSFNKGFDSLEYLQSAMLDMDWHLLASKDVPTDVAAFEKAALEKRGVAFDLVAPRYRSPYFAHSFAGGYSAGYYAYIWSEVLAADAFAHTLATGGLGAGKAFEDDILARGGTAPAKEIYSKFRGGEPKVDAFLKRRGLN